MKPIYYVQSFVSFDISVKIERKTNIVKHYIDYDVDSFSFYPEQDANADIRIHVKQKI